MNYSDYFINAFKHHYLDFTGRARRSEYWYFMLFHVLIIVGLGIIPGLLDSGLLAIPLGIYMLGSFLPSLAVMVRRLHDTNKSGFWYFISWIPYVGSLILIVLLVQDSTPDRNQYGPNPKEALLDDEDDITRHLVE